MNYKPLMIAAVMLLAALVFLPSSAEAGCGLRGRRPVCGLLGRVFHRQGGHGHGSHCSNGQCPAK